MAPDTRQYLTLSGLKGSLEVAADDTADDGRYQEYVDGANSWVELEVSSVGDDVQLDRDGYFQKKCYYAALAHARGMVFEHENWVEKSRASFERAQRDIDALKERIRAGRGGRQRLVGASRGLAEPQVLPIGGVSGYVTRAL